MNIHESKSEIFGSSPKNRPEMQSCKLNDSESRPNVTLKKIGHELDIAQTKCLVLKSELNYMMGVCQEAGIKGSKGASDVSQEQIVSSSRSRPNLQFSIEHHSCDSEITDTCHTPKSTQFSSRKMTRDDVTERCDNANLEEKQKRLNFTITPRAQLDNKLFPAMETVPVRGTTDASGEHKSRLPCYSEHPQSALHAKRSVEELTSRAKEDRFRAVPGTARGDLTKLELDLDRSSTTQTARAKSKHTSRTQRHETNSTCRMSGVKTRKRKGKLRSSASKSTIATKDTCVISRRDVKRRKQKGHGIARQQLVVLQKQPKKPNDVVEIFHNTALKNSNSCVSSTAHFKCDRETRCTKDQRLADTSDQKTLESRKKLHSECANREYQSFNQENHHHQALHQNPGWSVSENVKNKTEQNKLKERSDNSLSECKTQSGQVALSRSNDPMLTPNYEMPTLSSKLKRSSRSYINRFNFRNIPFVVGTSVTPSHNLGLNIQQVLSVMKAKQPIANITPLLIRKMSQGMRPASSLLEQINRHCERSVLRLSSQVTAIGLLNNNTEERGVSQNDKLFALDLQHVGRARSVHASNLGSARTISERDYSRIKQRSTAIAKKSDAPAGANVHHKVSRISFNKEDNIGDHKTYLAGSRNSKEIRDILINLHDQFENMNVKYEKLQSEAERSSDKAVEKELSTLEKELNTKEEEINVVVSLYKEVMTLKQQMKTLHERNSLVCVTTESVAHKGAFPISVIPGGSRLTNASQIFGRRRGTVLSVAREPPASMQLVALLRQIQTFHKQLQLM